MEDLNALIIGDPHIVESAHKDIQELNEKIIRLIKSVNIDKISFKNLNDLFQGKHIDNLVNQIDKLDFVVIMGDLLDKHERSTVYPHVQAVNFLKSIKEELPVFLIIGNHDRPHNTDFLSDIHFFTGMTECKNLYIIDKVKIFNLFKSNGKLIIEDCENKSNTNEIGSRFAFVPYVPNGRFMEALETKKEYINGICCFFVHQEFYGAKYNGLVSHSGDKIEGILPLVISGHIHEYGTFKNVIYVGSSRQIYKKDDPNKTVSIFSFKNGKMVEETKVDLNLRRKIIIESGVNNLFNLTFPDNAVIYLMISGNSSEIKALKKNQMFKLWEKNKNLKISYNIIDPDPVDVVYNGKISDLKNENISYLIRLKNKLQSNPEQLVLFDKIFNA